MIAYLHGCQMIGFKRLTEVCQGLFGLTISQGAIANVLARVGEAIAGPAERIAAEVRASEVIASDETSARVKGKTWWQWTFGCATAVYHVIAPTRGKCVPTDFLGGAKPQMWLSDRLAAQLGHAEEHQFCLAHLIRDAQYAIDHGDTIFAPDFKALLKDACAVGGRRPDLADATIAAHRRRLERQLERLLARKPTDAEGRKLRDAVYVDCTDKLFVFLKRRDAAPTNNESERALRPLVIFRKVTNGFRSEAAPRPTPPSAQLSKPAAATAGALSPPSATPWRYPQPRQPTREQPTRENQIVRLNAPSGATPPRNSIAFLIQSLRALQSPVLKSATVAATALVMAVAYSGSLLIQASRSQFVYIAKRLRYKVKGSTSFRRFRRPVILYKRLALR